MKAPNFSYVRPASLDEALSLLERHGEGAAPLAGGQSLLAAMNLRVVRPELLVDLAALDALRGIAGEGEEVRIGALTRHCEVARSPIVRERLPLLAEAMPHVGHVAIRNRGTLGGSLAFADPAAEMPACIVALDGTIVLGSRAGRREIPASAFFTGMMETDLAPGELILEVRLRGRRPGEVSAFAELSRRHGDFALAGLAAWVAMAGPRVAGARFVYLGCADRAKVAETVSRMVVGSDLAAGEPEGLAEAIEADLDPGDAPGCRAATRRQLARVVTRRVLAALHERAAS